MPKTDDITTTDATDATITPKELAAEMGLSPKNLRRFMRSILDDRAGSGNRYALTPELVAYIKERHAQGNHKVVTPRIPTTD
jgi:hypothetical protein